MGYLIGCRMPGCEWRTKRPGEYVLVEGALMQHMLVEHTTRQMAEALIAGWQYLPDGHRSSEDPLSFVREHAEPDEPTPPPKPKPRRRTGGTHGRRPRFGKTYAQMVLVALEQAGGALTTAQIRESMSIQASATIPHGSVCATLHKMRESEKIEHVGKGEWKKHEEAH